MKDSLRPGLGARLVYAVPEQRTVQHLLPESAEFAAMPAVLATGYLVGIVEWTCIRALSGHLDPGEQTLGVHVDLSHDAPTPPGQIITVEVELTAVHRRQLTFEVRVSDDAAVVCTGRHRRAVVDRERFDAQVAQRAKAAQEAPVADMNSVDVLTSTSSARPSTGEPGTPTK